MKTIACYGLGVDSTAILTRWLVEPATRPCAIEDLIVLTAMTGDEYPDTQRDVEEHLLPLLRKHGVRYVQVARAGRFERDGIVVLDDSRSPTKLYREGAWKLSDELRTAGTLPARRGSQKLCTQKFKGWVLDTWIKGELKGEAFTHVIGFESEETERVERDQGYTTLARVASYPLVDWAWNREKCVSYLREQYGITWKKSACVQCPFASLKGSGCVDRFKADPDSAVKAMQLEALSLMLNPRVGLFSGRTLRQVVEKSGNVEAMKRFEAWFVSQPTWSVYRVRRAYTAPAKASRELTTVFTGGYDDARAHLIATVTPEADGFDNNVTVDEHGFVRGYARRRVEGVYPSCEEMFVVGPAGIEDKVSRTTFDKRWAACPQQVSA